MIPNQVGRNSNVVALEPTSLYSAYRHTQGELQGLKRLQFANTCRPASYAREIGCETSSWYGHPLNTTHQDTSTVAGDPQRVSKHDADIGCPAVLIGYPSVLLVSRVQKKDTIRFVTSGAAVSDLIRALQVC